MARNVVAGDVTSGRGQGEDDPGFRALAACYEEALGRDPQARGEVALRYPIPDSGAEVCVSASDVRDVKFVICAKAALAPLANQWFSNEKMPVLAVIQLAQGEEEGSRQWYGSGQRRWDGDQAPRMQDVPADPARGPASGDR